MKSSLLVIVAIVVMSSIVLYNSESFAIGVPPTERGYVRDIGIVNLQQDEVNYPLVDYQYQFNTEFGNNQDKPQKFVWLGQIQDESKRTVYLTWINGTLPAKDGSVAEFSWIPQETGKYTVTSFVWESLDNPSALTPPIRKDFQVFDKLESNQITVDGFVINFKTENAVVENLWFTEQRNSFDIRVVPDDDAKINVELPFRIFLSDDVSLAHLNFTVLSDDIEIPFTSTTKSSSAIFHIPLDQDVKFIRIVGFLN